MSGVLGFISELFTSNGLKRKIVVWLTTLIEFLLSLPVLPPSLLGAVATLNQALQALGGVAVTHAVVKKTVFSKGTILSLAAGVNGLILLSTVVPVLLPLVPTLIKISVYLNPLAAGTTLGSKLK